MRPFLLACAARHSSLCALGFSGLEQLAAYNALSRESSAALVELLAQARVSCVRVASRTFLLLQPDDLVVWQVDDDDEEPAQLKALQTTLTVLQSLASQPSSDDAVQSLVFACFRLLSGAQCTNAVRATAAATLRQAVSVLLQRASQDAGAGSSALALLGAICAIAHGRAAPALAAPLPRAFAVDLLDDALRAHALLFRTAPTFCDLLAQTIFPLLADLLAGGAAQSVKGSGARYGSATGTALPASIPDDVGVDPARVAEHRCTFRTASTAVCLFARTLPRQIGMLLARLLAASQAGDQAAWYRAAAFEGLHRCAADAHLARSLVEALPCEPRVTVLGQICVVATATLADAVGPDAVRT